VPFSKQLRSFAETGCPCLRSRAVGLVGLPQKPQRPGVEAAKRLRLNSIGDGADEELAASMARRFFAPESAPLLFQFSTSQFGESENLSGDRGFQFLL
jgi:hypothetical protein